MSKWRHEKPAAARGYGPRWQKLREIVRARDKGLCQECKRSGRVRAGNQCDHITPKNKGGTDALNNLQWLCAPCHDAKTIRDAGGTVRMGCDTNGVPQDPAHHWSAE